MGRRINPEYVKSWYDPWKLKAEIMYHGHEEYAPYLAGVMKLSEKTIKHKINKTVLSHDDTITIAKALNFDLKKYEEIFLKDVFDE